MSRYNLIDEKWIPVRFPDGSRDELGIKDTLLRAETIAAIEDSSPLVVAALHRFLLAVLYRALEGPTDINQAKEWFKNGWPEQKIVAYLEKWRNRFWLFDEKFPFGQIPDFEPHTWRTWPALAAEHNADNAKVLFDHVGVAAPGSITAAAAVRWLFATLTFSVSSGKSELSHTSTAPSATAIIALPIGRNLQDSLMFLLVPQNREIAAADHALWECHPETVENLRAGLERSTVGLADRYTWRTRTIRFLPNETIHIEKLAFASGVGKNSDDQIDPMIGYRIDEKQGKLPLQFTDRGLWREFDSLLPDEAHLAPMVIEHATALARLQSERFPSSVLVLGQANNKAKIKYWRMERFTLPGALLGDRFIRSEIRRLLIDAEDAQKALWAACRSFARNLLSRGDREPFAKDISAYISQLPVNTWYWSDLESHFYEILGGYTLARNPEDIRYQWLKNIRTTLKDAWKQHHAAFSMGDAWAIRALVKSETAIRRKLKELNEEIAKLEPLEEEV